VNPVRPLEFGIYLPQVGFDYPQLLERAQWVEELGFDSLWLFDHLFFDGPAAPVFEAWTTATALLSQTTSLRVGHLVLCANFRHPVLLGKMVNTLQAIVPGRFVLGLGSGSTEPEHRLTGLPWGTFGERTQRLAETLEIVTRMTRGLSTRFEGEIYTVDEIPNLPRPQPPPVVIGGKGARTLDLVARYADWWNCPTYALGELETLTENLHAACQRAGRDPATVGISTESVLALVEHEREVPDALALAERRFGGPMWGLHDSGFVGTPETVQARLQAAVDRGVRSFVFFLHDRVRRETLQLLADEVIAPLRRQFDQPVASVGEAS
jgi:alkanesulfonate monooxygenase SsuD/methylene tetrahydromethanopterin reductase-like flavin-dependent oxidoreductase (luciferase family)